VRDAPCAELAELRSAFVDGALNDTDRDRLLRHLVDCIDCRRDIEDLRAVRELLNQSKTEPGPTPTDLSMRLVSIAGTESVAPLWTRPFRRTP
jgi:anti-sigma factor RsiW